MKCKLKNSYYWLLLLAFLPSGSLCGIPIKIIIALISLISLILRESICIKRPTKVLIFSALATLPWALLSLINGYSDGMLSFYKSYFPFLLVLLLTYIYIDNGLIDYKKALKYLKIAAFILLGFKIILEILLMLNMIDYTLLSTIFEKILNSSWVSLKVTGGIYRITTVNDDLVLIIIGLIILTRNDKSVLKNFAWALLGLFYTIIVFSRVTIIEYLVILFIAFNGYYYRNCNVKGVITFSLFYLLCIGGALYCITNETIMAMIQARFSGTYSTASDVIRTGQLKYLFEGFKNSPILGNGLGAYVKECIRSATNIHSYELEWMALFYQLGVVGIFLIIGSMLYSICIRIFKGTKDLAIQVFLAAVFSVWLVKPLFNPNMFASHSAVILSLLIIISNVYGRKNIVCQDSSVIKHKLSI